MVAKVVMCKTRSTTHEQTAMPFEWRFTRSDLAKLLERLAETPDYQTAA